MTEKKSDEHGKFKNALLSSGLPLEYSVREVMKKLGFQHVRELSYLRENSDGRETDFSIDVHSVRSSDLSQIIWYELFIECKYRSDNTSWVFIPEKKILFTGSDYGFHNLFIMLDQFNPKIKFNTKEVNNFTKTYDLCSKGIELKSTNKDKNDDNPHSIRRAISQLQYSLIHRVILHLNKFKDIHYDEACLAFIPIIVTTADLWRMRPETTIEEIRKSANIEDICDKKNSLLYYEEPNNELLNYSLKHLSKILDGVNYKHLNELLKDNWHKSGFENFMKIFAQYLPSTFLIVNYKKLEEEVKSIIDFLSPKNTIR